MRHTFFKSDNPVSQTRDQYGRLPCPDSKDYSLYWDSSMDAWVSSNTTVSSNKKTVEQCMLHGKWYSKSDIDDFYPKKQNSKTTKIKEVNAHIEIPSKEPVVIIVQDTHGKITCLQNLKKFIKRILAIREF